MNSVFVRGLWGDTDQQSSDCPTSTLPKTYADIVETWLHFRQPKPCLNFVFGDHNAQFLRDYRIPHLQISGPSGIVNWTKSDIRNTHPDSAGRVNWGISFWRHKMECIKLALQSFDQVVWLDWDCRLVRPLPDDFWTRLARGQPFQALLRRYKRPHVPSGVLLRSWRLLPHGAFLYFSRMDLVEYAISLHSTFPTYTDEVAYAVMVQKLGANTMDPARYSEGGFQPYCYATLRGASRPEILVFSEGIPENDTIGKSSHLKCNPHT